MWLHEMSGGKLLVSAGVELLAPEVGKPLTRHPERLTGLRPPGMANRWTVLAVGGHWPDATYMVVNELVGCTNPIDAAYGWNGERWELVTPQTDVVSMTFDSFMPFANRSVFASVRYELNNELRDCEAPSAKLARALAKPRPRHHVLVQGEAPQRAPKLEGQVIATADGDLRSIVRGALTHLRHGRSNSETHALPPSLKNAKEATIVRVDGEDVLVSASKPARLVRFDGSAWSDLEIPAATTISAVDARAQWLVARTEREDEADDVALWRRDDATWSRVTLPPLSFEGYGSLADWVDDTSAVVLDPWQIVVQRDAARVLGHHPAGGDGASALFSTIAAGEPVRIPDYDAQRLETIAKNPELKPQAE